MENATLFRDKSVLITGGLGFIGSNLARRLVEYGARITLVDSLIPEYGGNLFNIDGIEDRVRLNITDVRDRYSMAYLVRDQDYLFNLAGQVSHTDSMVNPYTDLDVNVHAAGDHRGHEELPLLVAGLERLAVPVDQLPGDRGERGEGDEGEDRQQ